MAEANVLDLDSERQSRAAANEVGDGLPVRFGGETIATLPPECPVDVFQPVVALDIDLGLLFRAAFDAVKGEADQALAATDLVVDLLTVNPNLPREAIQAIQQVGKRLLGDDGYAAFVAQRPSPNDIAALAKGVFRFYGLSLGEASAPSDSSEGDGQTSKPTSSAGTDLTPVASSASPETTASSAPAAS